MLKIGQIVANRYQVEKIVRHPSLYLAQDRRLNREVLLEFLLFNDNTTHLEQSRFAATLKHPNFIEIYDFQQNSQEAYLAMDYPEGSTLVEQLGIGTLPLKKALSYFRQIVTALKYAHLHDFICSDLQPQNLWLMDKLHTRLVLADVGLIQVSGQHLLDSDSAEVGAPSYFAPERWSGRLGKSSDVYAAGIIMYEMLTSEPAKSHLLAEIPMALNNLLQQMTDPSPTQRPTIGEVIEQLDQLETNSKAAMPVAVPTSFVSSSASALSAIPVWHGTKKAAFKEKLNKGFTVFGIVMAGIILLGGLGFVGMAVLNALSMSNFTLAVPRTSPTPIPYVAGAITGEGDTKLIKWSPNGTFLASGHSDGAVRLWKANGTSLGAVQLPLEHPIDALAWSPDSKFLAFASGSDKNVRVLEVASGQITRNFDGDMGILGDLQWSPDSKYLAYATKNFTLRVWDRGGRNILTNSVSDYTISKLAWSQNSHLLAVGYGTGITVWDMTTDSIETNQRYQNSNRTNITADVSSISWSSDNTTVAVGYLDGRVQLQRANNVVANFKDSTFEVNLMAWSLNGTILATGNKGGTATLRNADGTFIALLKGHNAPLQDLKWSSDGQRLATADREGEIRIWDISGQQDITILTDYNGLGNLSWSSNGKRLAYPTTNDKLHYWDGIKSYQPIPNDIFYDAIAWSPDGKTLAAGSGNTVLFWKP